MSPGIALLTSVRALIEKIAKHDRDLARQFRRAASSVALNIAEGRGGQGGNARLRFQTALQSARECRACIDVATAWRYVSADQAKPALGGFDEVAAMLWTLTRRSPL